MKIPLEFVNCVLHVTTFFFSVNYQNIIDEIFQENEDAIWTFSYTSNTQNPIKPLPQFQEICSINILLNSESIDLHFESTLFLNQRMQEWIRNTQFLF